MQSYQSGLSRKRLEILFLIQDIVYSSHSGDTWKDDQSAENTPLAQNPTKLQPGCGTL